MVLLNLLAPGVHMQIQCALFVVLGVVYVAHAAVGLAVMVAGPHHVFLGVVADDQALQDVLVFLLLLLLFEVALLGSVLVRASLRELEAHPHDVEVTHLGKRVRHSWLVLRVVASQPVFLERSGSIEFGSVPAVSSGALPICDRISLFKLLIKIRISLVPTGSLGHLHGDGAEAGGLKWHIRLFGLHIIALGLFKHGHNAVLLVGACTIVVCHLSNLKCLVFLASVFV